MEKSVLKVGAEEKVFIEEHPLIRHKISILRNKKTGTLEFRTCVEEIAMLIGYDAMQDLTLKEVEMKTPLETCMSPMLSGKKPVVVPILRAGLGMVPGMLKLIPNAKIGHLGMYRDEQSHESHAYYSKLPGSIDQRTIFVCDPMLATGGSAVSAVDFIKKQGGKRIKFLCIIAAPEGVKRLHEAHPDIEIYIGTLDRELNSEAYICPGLGDAGDRIFGTQ